MQLQRSVHTRALTLAFLSTLFVLVPTSAQPRSIRTLVTTQRVVHLDAPAREPMLAEHPNGELFVAGYGAGRPVLRKSRDRGVSWTRVDVGGEAEGAIGNSDVDLAIAPDGTLYFVAMSYNRKIDEGTGIAVGASRDRGLTWKWTALSRNRFDDRPWVEVAPDGTAHVVWNDGGVNLRTSRDRGASWSSVTHVAPRGCSSHFAIGPRGELAVRITPSSASGNKFAEGVDLIAVSADGGASWETHPAPGKRDWDKDWGTPDAKPGLIEHWVEPLAWDAQGNLHSLWTDATGIWLARSQDRGATWTQSRIIDTTDNAHFPYLAARGSGEIAATWFTGDGESLRWHVARVDLSPDGSPRVAASEPLDIDARIGPDRPGDAAQRTSAGEYISVRFLTDGSIAAVSPIQDPLEWRYGFTFWRFVVK
jgi:hypothetical protein